MDIKSQVEIIGTLLAKDFTLLQLKSYYFDVKQGKGGTKHVSSIEAMAIEYALELLRKERTQKLRGNGEEL